MFSFNLYQSSESKRPSDIHRLRSAGKTGINRTPYRLNTEEFFFFFFFFDTHILVVSLDAPPRDVELTDSKFVRIMYLTTRNKNYIATFAC